MLYIITNETVGAGMTKCQVERGWHTGEPNPIKHDEMHTVVEVQADGDELRFICPGGIVQFRYGRVVRFFGDDAKFIVANSLT